MTSTNNGCGFDSALNTYTYGETPLAAVAYDGASVVTSTHACGTFVEKIGLFTERIVAGGVPATRILDGDIDSIGFFGDMVDLLVYTRRDILSVAKKHTMKVVAKFKIRPGSLFVPKSSDSDKIGIVSPSGRACVINDDGSVTQTPLTVPEGYSVIWSDTVQPVGYCWASEGNANMYIRSSMKSKGMVFSSEHGFTFLTVWGNPYLKEFEAYIVTNDAPHIVKRVASRSDGDTVENVVTMQPGTIIEGLSCFIDGRPLVAYGRHGAQRVAQPIPPEEELTTLLTSMHSQNDRVSESQCASSNSLLTYAQTPITPPIPYVTRYSNPGRPRYEVSGAIPHGYVDSPKTNTVLSFDFHGTRTYRIVSPYELDRHMPSRCYIVVDPDGDVASGRFSPTVKMLYESDSPVAILPIGGKATEGMSSTKIGLMISALSRELMKNRVAMEVCVVAAGDSAASAVMAGMDRKNRISKIFLFNPTNEAEARTSSRVGGKIVRIFSEDMADNSYSDKDIIVSPSIMYANTIENILSKN